MGSTINDIKCEQCGNEQACYECFYKQGKEVIFCRKCGYSWQNNQGKIKSKKGKGVFHIQVEGGFEQEGGLKNKKDFEKWFKEIKKERVIFKRCYYTYYKNGDIRVKDLISNTDCKWEINEMLDRL